MILTSKNLKPVTKADELLKYFTDSDKTPITKVTEIDGKEIESMVCPYCGSVVKDFYRANGPDDYSKDAECTGCGAYWSA